MVSAYRLEKQSSTFLLTENNVGRHDVGSLAKSGRHHSHSQASSIRSTRSATGMHAGYTSAV